MSWKWAAILVSLLLLVVFTAQNYEVVNIQVLFWSLGTSRAIVIFSTFVIGFIIGWIASLYHRD